MRDYKLIFLIVFGSLVLLGISWIEFHLPEPPVTGGSNLNVAEALGGGDVSGWNRGHLYFLVITLIIQNFAMSGGILLGTYRLKLGRPLVFR